MTTNKILGLPRTVGTVYSGKEMADVGRLQRTDSQGCYMTNIQLMKWEMNSYMTWQKETKWFTTRYTSHANSPQLGATTLVILAFIITPKLVLCMLFNAVHGDVARCHERIVATCHTLIHTSNFLVNWGPALINASLTKYTTQHTAIIQANNLSVVSDQV